MDVCHGAHAETGTEEKLIGWKGETYVSDEQLLVSAVM